MSKFNNHVKAQELYKKSNNNFLRAGIFGFIFILSLVWTLLKYLRLNQPEIDLYKYPFIAEVWGTAADWTMIAVTFATAALLLLSFRAQKTANNIAYKNYKLSIKPTFSVPGKLQPLDHSDGYILEIELQQNPVYQFEFHKFNEDFVEDPATYPQGDIIFPGGKQYILFKKDLKRIINENAENQFLAEIYFTDAERNYYRQVIFTSIINTVYITGSEEIIS